MSCIKPNYMIDYGPDEVTGKHKTKFVYNTGDYEFRNLAMLQHYENDGVTKVYAIPCGKCPSCIKQYRMQWSLRCEAESKLYDKNCFVTLTYDEKHNDRLLHKSHLKEFIKKLRNRGVKLRYFGCGEYSPDSRPHYHIILFGYMPDDLKVISKSKSGFYLYKSPFIEKLWHKGLVTIQEFDSAVAGYVAGYVDKKMDQEDSFLMMSNRPGIGHDYYIKNIMQLYEHDKYISKNGFVAPLPRYADKVADSYFYDISDVKEKRQKYANKVSVGLMNLHGFQYFEELFNHNGSIESRRMKYARSL